MKKVIPRFYVPYIYAILGILVSIFLLLTYLLMKEYAALSDFHAHHGKHVATKGSHVKSFLGIDDTSLVSEWMTFEYVARVFGVPVLFLKKELALEDKAFPHITLYRYAKHQGIAVQTIVEDVANAVTRYLLEEEGNKQ